MKIGKKSFSSIIVKDSDDMLVALITDEEVITYGGYEVVFEPEEE
ncbi:MAG: hypothetical protein PHN69_03910 [Candidatus Pacebacteria bacterium]|nr:hypothetical protein [Candidatus Paceibacterota bacterium]